MCPGTEKHTIYKREVVADLPVVYKFDKARLSLVLNLK